MGVVEVRWALQQLSHLGCRRQNVGPREGIDPLLRPRQDADSVHVAVLVRMTSDRRPAS